MTANIGRFPCLSRFGCFAIGLLAIALPFATSAQEETAAGYPVLFHVDSSASWLRVLVYRGGLLRGFGHNHVVSHHGIEGTILVGQDPLQSELSLEFAVGDLAVDKPEQRSLAGPDFPGRIREKDIAGTRRNLLGKKLLQEEQYPSIRIRSHGITGNMPEIGVEATVTVRGEEFTIVFPAQVDMSGDSIVASGQLELSHRDLGLKPFKAVLGTLRVRDMLILQYEITGVREVAAGQIAP
jgi:hypothetical protein